MFLLSLSLLSSVIPLWLENIFCIILTLSNAQFLSQHRLWSTSVNGPCMLEKNVLCSCWRAACSLNVNQSSGLMVSSALVDSADSSISYYLERRAGTPIITVDLSACFGSLSFCIMYFAAVIHTHLESFVSSR